MDIIEIGRSVARKHSHQPSKSILQKNILENKYGRVSKSHLRAVANELKSKVQSKQKVNDNEGDMCSVCYDCKSNTVFWPCYHGNVCRDCSTKHLESNTHCPICRKKVKRLILTQESSKKNIVQLKEDITPYGYEPSESEGQQSSVSIERGVLGSLIMIPSPRMSPVQMSSSRSPDVRSSRQFIFDGNNNYNRPLIVPIRVIDEESNPSRTSIIESNINDEIKEMDSSKKREIEDDQQPKDEYQGEEGQNRGKVYNIQLKKVGNIESELTLSKINEVNLYDEESHMATPLRSKKQSISPRLIKESISGLSSKNPSLADGEAIDPLHGSKLSRSKIVHKIDKKNKSSKFAGIQHKDDQHRQMDSDIKEDSGLSLDNSPHSQRIDRNGDEDKLTPKEKSCGNLEIEEKQSISSPQHSEYSYDRNYLKMVDNMEKYHKNK